MLDDKRGFDHLAFFASEHLVRGGRAVEDQPDPRPENAGGASQIEDPAPPEHGDNPGEERWRDDGADRGTGIEKTESESALAWREPFRHRLGRTGETTPLAHPEKKTKHPETEYGIGGADQAVGERPPDNHDRVAEARAEPIHDAPTTCIHDGVGEEEQRREQAILLVADRNV